MFYPDTFQISTPRDREIRITRDFDAPRQLVFDAFTKPELVRRWLLGSPGWTMPICEIDLSVGGAYRYVWRKEGVSDMGLGGVFQEIVSPERPANPAAAGSIVVLFLTGEGPTTPAAVNGEIVAAANLKRPLARVGLRVDGPEMAAEDILYAGIQIAHTTVFAPGAMVFLSNRRKSGWQCAGRNRHVVGDEKRYRKRVASHSGLAFCVEHREMLAPASIPITYLLSTPVGSDQVPNGADGEGAGGSQASRTSASAQIE